MKEINIPPIKWREEPIRNESILRHLERKTKEMQNSKEAMKVIFEICRELEKEKWEGEDFRLLRHLKKKAHDYIRGGN